MKRIPFRGLTAAAVLCAILTACSSSEPPPPPPAEPVLSQKDAELLEFVKTYQEWPEAEDLPLPPSGWYDLELGGDKIEVFRDEYGVPHVFAPSVDAAFRAQGYVITEDRCLQLLKTREAVMGRRAAKDGPGAVGHDITVRRRCGSMEGLQRQLDGLRPEQRARMEAYCDGINDYLDRYAPYVPHVQPIEMAAGCVYYMAAVSPTSVHQLQIHQLLTMIEAAKGKDLVRAVLHDALPLDVPNAPTTDHTYTYPRPHNSQDETVDAANAPLPIADAELEAFEPADIVALLEADEEAREFAEKDGQITKWGSQVWAVRPERTTTGNAMLFAGPMMSYYVPSRGAQVHLVAPGLNATGLAFIGVPGIILGHNERVAWGITSGFMNVIDMFREELNPDNPLQYKHNGEWRDMEMIDSPLVVRNGDDSYEVRHPEVKHTVHGAVVHSVSFNNQAYTQAWASHGGQVRSFAAFTDILMARDLDEFETAVHEIDTNHNLIAADVDGNIGYWLTGRFPKRHPDQDPRLPTPGTGERDWQGFVRLSKLVSCINPPQGWLGNFNQKPSVKTPGWWPEILWGKRINDILAANNPIDWETFLSINKANGIHHMIGPIADDYLIPLLRERGGDDPQFVQALALVEEWGSVDVPDVPGALIFTEWLMEFMVETLSVDFAPMVERSLALGNLQLFGGLIYRIMLPEKSGVKLVGDYMHGRDRDALALDCLKRILAQLTEKHGTDMPQWPYEPVTMKIGELDSFPTRACGTYWIATELSQPMRSIDMMVPGASGQERSPHFKDQIPLFMDWKMRPTPYVPEDFPPRI